MVAAEGGAPVQVVRRSLVLVCELLDMDIAYVTSLDTTSTPATRTVLMAVGRDGEVVDAATGLREPLEHTWCGPVVDEGALLVPDVATEPLLAALPTSRHFQIAAHAGTAVRDGDGVVIGTLCALAHRPHDTLNQRDLLLLQDLAEVLGPLLRQLDGPAVPTQRQGGGADLVPLDAYTAEGLESLTRPLLVALQQLTRLGSTYLTVIDQAADTQEIRYALNSRGDFHVPEGLQVPWTDTLCRRALTEGRVATTNVPELWGDSEAAAALGIQVYVSVPVELSNGQVWGTLCAADRQPVEDVEGQLPVMRLFSRLIAAEVERSDSLSSAVLHAERALLVATTDSLTGCSTRRMVEPWLARALARREPDQELVLVFVDLNDFKAVNDRLGHVAGDLVLAETARRLRQAFRGVDLVARYGGDEFVAAALMSPEGMPSLAHRLQQLESFPVTAAGEELTARCAIGVTSEPAGGTSTPVELLQRADAAMYARKRSRPT